MKKSFVQRKFTTTVAVVALIAVSAQLPSYAGRFAQNHPRRAQVLGRDRSLGGQLNSDRGHLGGNFQQLRSEQQGIRQQEQTDARANGGYITRGEQRQFNKEEGGLQGQMNQDYRNASPSGSFGSNHPRRAQVLNQDGSMQNQINGDRGSLGGQYNHLSREDNGIAREEQRDARQNGGYITRGQETQLQNQEGRLQNQINRDQQ